MLRVDQFAKWATTAHQPVIFWMSGFTFPTGFLTAVLQTCARQNNVSVDSLSWEFVVSTVDDSNITQQPKVRKQTVNVLIPVLSAVGPERSSPPLALHRTCEVFLLLIWHHSSCNFRVAYCFLTSGLINVTHYHRQKVPFPDDSPNERR